MKQKIKWKRDISGQTIEALSGEKPLAAIPQQEGDLSCAILNWSYKKGQLSVSRCSSFQIIGHVHSLIWKRHKRFPKSREMRSI